MAKSTRSKVKRAYRAKKREDGVYAAIEAARLERLSSKLRAVRDTDKDGDVEFAEINAERRIDAVTAAEDGTNDVVVAAEDSMALDNTKQSSSDRATSKKVSTHGPRISRRTEWRLSKGLPARPKSRGMNRQGGIASKSRPGRPQRRR